ncbi:MAG TPA: hypothetical protein VFB80_09175 [Pirellulaceae bacterium]|nr:hypothetical protein [Pirellulaceae bacterium]
MKDENPYQSPQEAGYFPPRLLSVAIDWLCERMWKLVLGLLLSLVAQPFVVAFLWIHGEFRL